MAKERPHQIAREDGALGWKPGDQRVGRLAAWSGVQLEAAITQRESVAVDKGGCQDWFGRLVGAVDVGHVTFPQLLGSWRIERLQPQPIFPRTTASLACTMVSVSGSLSSDQPPM